MQQRKTQWKGIIFLTLTAFIWGSSFIAQSVGMESVQAFTFNGIRTLLGALTLVPVILVRDLMQKKKMTIEELQEQKAINRTTLRYGLLIGFALFIASNLQQYAFYDSTSGKIAFITSMYMFFVPIIGLFFRKRIPWLTWVCIAAGFIGLYFLCIDPGSFDGINRGDFFAFLCAIAYAGHILLVEKIAPRCDGVRLSFTQFAVSGALSCICMFIFEQPDISAIRQAALPILYSGVMSCGFAYTFQIIGQTYTEATVASLIMCMESVFAVLCSAVVLNEMLSGREIIGCVIMFIAIIASQFSSKLSNKNSSAKLRRLSD